MSARLKINYEKLFLHIKKKQPIYISELLRFIEDEFNVKSATHRSNVISKLVLQGYLVREGINNKFVRLKRKNRNDFN